MLPDGNIQITENQNFIQGATINSASSLGDGGNVYIDARGSIRIDGIITTSSGASGTALSPGNAGNIRLIANENIELSTPNVLEPNLSLQSTGLLGGSINLASGNRISLENTRVVANSTSVGLVAGSDKGGNINFSADSVVAESSLISTSTSGGVEAGDITIASNNSAQFIGIQSGLRSDSGISFGEFLSDTARGSGNIMLQASSLLIDNGTISASTVNKGDSGIIEIQVNESLVLQNNATISSNVEQGSTGNGAGIFIETGSLEISSGSQIQSLISGEGTDPLGNQLLPAQGNSGEIQINVMEDIKIGGTRNGFPSQISTTVESGGIGDSGNIRIQAENLRIDGQSTSQILDGAIRTSIEGNGNAGNIDIDLNNTLQISGLGSGLFSVVSSGGQGDSGNINVFSGSVQLLMVPKLPQVMVVLAAAEQEVFW
ncbi:MAG: hypothetical protein HC929_16035 [Leptolyngbyaceae cyanobacterium SM2_5_2]|nr:hypothetical protein [Leptolyngbyaceae cyanobacterium SM2_5_2]